MVSPKAKIGKNTTIAESAIVEENVVIGENVCIQSFCHIGASTGKEASEPLVIGDNSLIRSHCVLYEGSQYEEGLSTGHYVLLRERTKAGKSFHVGSFSDIEGDCQFGDYVRLHSYVHIGKHSQIGHFVKFYPLVTLTNDPLPPSHIVRGSYIGDGVVLCVGVTVLPGTVMKAGAFAGAGSLVSGEIGEGRVLSDDGARTSLHVTRLMDLETGARHPWMNHFKDAYPEDEQVRIEELRQIIVNSGRREKNGKG